ncbi:hypothetical protein NKH57_32685 [Mesorhizobium sp. M1050]|uniref:hypothetical protein n=1 Tax=Mesorhizobium sp. M1050 TaxID=2957051 RepID=UPI003338B60A
MANITPIRTKEVPNGPGAAAILAAGIGSAAMGIFALAGDAFTSLNHFFTFYKPTGGLSGVSTSAVVAWLVAWFILSRRWGEKNVEMVKVVSVSFALLAVGVLLTFPPVMDLIQGK